MKAGEIMSVKKAARDCCSNHTPITVHVIDRRTTPIIDEFDRYTTYGAAILGVSFGLMLLIGAWFGWL